MKFYLKAAALIMLTVSLTISACGGDGDSGGNPETPASTVFTNKTYLAPGTICPNGGIQIDIGFDNNRNNVLDADEIIKTEYMCNGEGGEDASSHPCVIYTIPTPNKTDVELDTVISAVFNTEMDETTITDQTFTVKDSNGSSVAGNVSYSGIVASFTPVTPLNINMKYTVALESSIENDNDIPMGYNHKIYFTGGKAAVIYKANGATGGTVPVNTNRYNTGDSVTASANTGNLTKTGFTLSGWNTKADGSGTTYAVNAPVSITTSSVILYAIWTTAYTVTYDGNDATNGAAPSDSNLYTFGQNVTVKSNTGTLEKSGMHFAGWNTNSSGTGTTYAPDAIFQMGNANVTLYARWITDQFFSAATPGDVVTITVGTATFNMIYANNAASITFPTGTDDSTTATITTKFFMGKTEVTYELWKTVYDWATNPVRTNLYYFANAGIKGNDGAAGKSTQHPVTTINWRDAMVWCNALTEYYNDINGTAVTCVYTYSNNVIRDSRDVNASACDGAVASASAKGFRLPTNMEWEYAARYRINSTNTVAGYSNPYFTKGNSASGATTYYNDYTGTSPNFAGKLANDKVAVYKYYWNGTAWIDNLTVSTAVVMSKGAAGANSLGLYDMSGNVCEWCFDLNGSNRVLRPGNWLVAAVNLQSGYWIFGQPDFENWQEGFRLARTQ